MGSRQAVLSGTENHGTTMNETDNGLQTPASAHDKAAQGTTAVRPAPQAELAGPPPRPWLVADIGGTNARFGWVAEGSDAIAHVATLPGAEHSGPAAAARAYLEGVRRQLGAAYRPPRGGAFAVATAVGGDQIDFTNSGWAFSRRDTEAELDLDTLLMLNDFEALALSLPTLGPAQLRAHAALPDLQAGGTLAVIGPGTGLGVAGLVPTRHGWVALPGEGGHVTVAATDDFETALLAAVRRRHPHVSAERLISGIGMPTLHAGVATVLGQDPGDVRLATSDIVARGLAGGDAVCERTLQAFCALLGSFAGNVALTLGARGGVFIGGGIVPRLGDTFFESPFRERFEAKGRFQEYLKDIPTALILDTSTALAGARLALSQLGR